MGNERRRMTEKKGMEARNQQAARDALRRRQKAKKAKTVKRHVRYKDKLKLLAELESNKSAAPIVASELPRFDEEEEDVIEKNVPSTNSTALNEPEKSVQVSPSNSEIEKHTPMETASLQKDGDEVAPVEATVSEEPKAKKKYLPFTKQVKQYEKLKGEREARRREHEKRINIREKMLSKSKKNRRERVRCLLYVRRVEPLRLTMVPFSNLSNIL